MTSAGPQAANSASTPHFLKIAGALCEVGKDFYRHGWAMGTSGNYSAVLSWEPLRLAITSSGLDKGALIASHILEMDATGNIVCGDGRPSAESLLHLAIVRERQAGAVLHTHSVWATVLSQRHGAKKFLVMEDYEMLKGLAGIQTHQHRELLPILENSQNMVELSGKVEEILRTNPGAHGFLLRGHGLYTWGEDLSEAKRHVEIFEFLLEALGRTEAL